MNKIIQGNCLEKLKELPENSVDSIVTDPPYELGFMGKSWDNTGIANNKEMWAECLRVLSPGGYLLSFGGTRTYHRMACAIEDAGFEVRDMIAWVYGSGFPKSLNIGKSINQLETNEWLKISKALDNIDQKSIMEVWKKDALFATIKLSKSIIEVGINTPKNFFVPDIAVLYHNPLNEQLSAIFAELKLSVLNHISEENEIIVQKNVGQITIPSLNLARYAVKLSQSLGVSSWNIFTAECDVKEWLNENTEVNHKVDEALKTLRGNKKYSNEEIISVLCVALTDTLRLTILNQSKTFQNLDTNQKMECASAISVIITEYTAENLISNTVAILKGKAVDKIQGNEREEEDYVGPDGKKRWGGNTFSVGQPPDGRGVNKKTKGTSEWEGWGTALKPAHEPICMARKPLAESTVASNVLKWKVGGINIDESRVIAYNEQYEHTRVSKIKGGEVGSISKLSDLRKRDACLEVLPKEQKKTADLLSQMSGGINEGEGKLGLERGGLGLHSDGLQPSSCGHNVGKGQGSFTKSTGKVGIGTQNDNGKTIRETTKRNGDGSSYQRGQEGQSGGEPNIIGLGVSQQATPKIDEGISGTATREQKTTQNNIGRWPSNLIHDNSEEVRECFPETKTGKAIRSNSGGKTFGGENTKPVMEDLGYEDGGGNASRFFKSIIKDLHCSLCYDILNHNHLTKNICNNTNVNNAEKSLETIQAITEDTAQLNATQKARINLVQNVKSAGNLCDLCGTFIAQWLVEPKKAQSQESILGQVSITEPNLRILKQCLASFVELRGNTDTTPTMENLNLLFGYVFNAIENSTQNYEDTKNIDKNRYRSLAYYPKASKSERNKGCEELEEKMVNSLGGKFLDKVLVRKNEPNLKDVGEYIKKNRMVKKLSMNELSKHFPSKSGGITGRVHNWESGKELPTKEQWLKLKEILKFGNEYDETMTEFIEIEANEKSKDFNVITKNNHPTVKPIALMEYLIKMVTPKGGIVLDPFMGSGSTGVATKLKGYGFIGIELNAEYIKIAEERIRNTPEKLL